MLKTTLYKASLHNMFLFKNHLYQQSPEFKTSCSSKTTIRANRQPGMYYIINSGSDAPIWDFADNLIS